MHQYKAFQELNNLETFDLTLQLCAPTLHGLFTAFQTTRSPVKLLLSLLAFVQSCCLTPVVNLLTLYVIGRRNFGRFLAAVCCSLLTLVTLLVQVCLLPRRFHLAASATDRLFAGTHLVASTFVLVNLAYHYACALLVSPGDYFVPDSVASSGGGAVSSVCPRCCERRPPRAHHCSVCRRCWPRMDHHCPWLDNCVGLRNHAHFYLALVYLSVGGCYLLTVGRGDFNRFAAEFDTAQMHALPPMLQSSPWMAAVFRRLGRISLTTTFFAVPLVIGLCIWQTFLISTNQTSVEYFINQRFSKCLQQRGLSHYRNPYNFGLAGNWALFFHLDPPSWSPLTYFILLRRLLFPFAFYKSAQSMAESGFPLNIPTLDELVHSLSAD